VKLLRFLGEMMMDEDEKLDCGRAQRAEERKKRRIHAGSECSAVSTCSRPRCFSAGERLLTAGVKPQTASFVRQHFLTSCLAFHKANLKNFKTSSHPHGPGYILRTIAWGS
jgi:hypothetical protein